MELAPRSHMRAIGKRVLKCQMTGLVELFLHSMPGPKPGVLGLLEPAEGGGRAAAWRQLPLSTRQSLWQPMICSRVPALIVIHTVLNYPEVPGPTRRALAHSLRRALPELTLRLWCRLVGRLRKMSVCRLRP